MREIKFRAWDKRNELWHLNPNNLDWVAVEGIFEPHLLKKSLVLCQFTGLKDKNGKEIYEGDILQWPHPEKSKGDVIWSDTMCSWMVQRQDYSETFSSFAHPRQLDGLCRFEVIGNIYEHPHLLIDPDLKTNEV